MREFIESVIKTGNYILADMEARIQKMYVLGKITEEDLVALTEMAAEYADDSKQIDITAVLADLEARIAVLESAGVVVWKSGMSTAKGQTVLYDIIKEGTLRYCRYDGGRASTSLSPGKIDGWVILASAGGEVTHRVEHDADGKIILVPVNEEPTEES
jgi:hypothetical protein